MAITARANVHVAAPATATFAVLADPDRFHLWQHGMEPVEARRGPVRPGSRLRSRRRLAGMTVPFSAEVTEWDPPRRLSFRSAGTPLRLTGDYEIAAHGDTSVVTATLELRPGRGVGAALRGLGGRRFGERATEMMTAQLQQDLETLARLVHGPNEQDGPPR